jgi:hypothetical protein
MVKSHHREYGHTPPFLVGHPWPSLPNKKERVMPKSNSFAAALLALSRRAFAQIPPGAGRQFQQIPPPPTPQEAIPDIRIEQGDTPAIPCSDSLKITLNSLSMSGQTLDFENIN